MNPGRDLILVGASAGGLEPLQLMLAGLPPDLPACVLIVLHTSPHGGGRLVEVLRRQARLPVQYAREGEAIRPGHVFVAPPDFHLMVDEGVLRLSREATEHFTRPAVDPLFRTAAAAYRNWVIGVVLSGAGSDGTLGLVAVKRRGGVAVVQDPEEAATPSMPGYAVRHIAVDHVLPSEEIASTLDRLAREPVSREVGEQPDVVAEAGEIAIRHQLAQIRGERRGQPSVFTCPECDGTLWQVDEPVIQFRCHVGHLYSGEELLEGQFGATHAGAWKLLRYLTDQAVLARQLAQKAELDGRLHSAQAYERRAQEAEAHAHCLHRLLETMPLPEVPPTHPVHRLTGAG